MERGRKRQGLVPDFKMVLPSVEAGRVERLAELKCISCCPTYYQPGQETKAVDKRARQLPGLYRNAAKKVDNQFVFTPVDQVGPVERKLGLYGDLQCLVMGAFGEASEHTHSLVTVMAEARLAKVGLARGRPGSEGELGLITGQIRRKLSVNTVRAQAE